MKLLGTVACAILLAGVSSGSTSIITATRDAESLTTSLDLLRDRSVAIIVGPENAVYCILEDPQGFVVFDGFGRCNLILDKVGTEHSGFWKMIVGAPSKILTEEHRLIVNVVESAGKSVVKTHVEKVRPLVTISCSVETAHEVRSCKFRDPQGKILLAASRASEDRYDGSSTSSGSNVKTHNCSIRITDLLTTDIGLWRCAIKTTQDTYYGHMQVMCPWVQENFPAVVATIQLEPLLTAARSQVSVMEEESATLSCYVQSAIRYCYFRTANGTIFTVTPGMSSSSMEYVGAGFDAGECGIRFHGLQASDSGRWSCHVGLVGAHEELKDNFQLTVHERMSVDHYTGHGMVVTGIVYRRRALEYCRFVRIDGFGFTTDSVPSQYVHTGIIANGECRLTARNPSVLDMHPWTVVAKIRGQDVEIAKDTMEEIIIAPPATTEPTPGQDNHHGSSNALIIFSLVVWLLCGCIFVGVFVWNIKKDRVSTSNRVQGPKQ